MTYKEYKNLEHGDKVALVDNIEEVAGNEWSKLSSDIFTKNTIYKVNKKSDYQQAGWIVIQQANDGQTNHGWDYKRWQLVDLGDVTDEDIAEMYKALGMEALDG